MLRQNNIVYIIFPRTFMPSFLFQIRCVKDERERKRERHIERERETEKEREKKRERERREREIGDRNRKTEGMCKRKSHI